MLFDSTTLPEEKWLSLDDVVHFCAFGEPYVHGVREAGYPCDRKFVAEINEAAQRCLAEAGSDPKHSALVELLNKPGLWKADAVAPLLFECKPAWPPSGRRLYDLFAQYERAQADEVVKLEAASDQVEAWLMSDKVVFEGDRNGRRQRLVPARIYGVTVVWQNRTVSAYLRDPGSEPRLLNWEEVQIERASLVQSLDEKQTSTVTRISSLQASSSAAIPTDLDIWRGSEPWPRDRSNSRTASILVDLD